MCAHNIRQTIEMKNATRKQVNRRQPNKGQSKSAKYANIEWDTGMLNELLILLFLSPSFILIKFRSKSMCLCLLWLCFQRVLLCLWIAVIAEYSISIWRVCDQCSNANKYTEWKQKSQPIYALWKLICARI